MTEGQLKSLAVVARKLREQEEPFKAAGDPSGIGIGAAALLVEMAGAEVKRLRYELNRVASMIDFSEGAAIVKHINSVLSAQSATST